MEDLEIDPNDPDRMGTGGRTGLAAPETIVCVDCGGTCHLLSHPYEDEHGRLGFTTGDIVSYRCADCLDRWDVELDEADA